jgi:hypothetical protein
MLPKGIRVLIKKLITGESEVYVSYYSPPLPKIRHAKKRNPNY